MRRITAIIFALLWATTATAASLDHQFRRGIEAYKSGDYVMAGQKMKIVLEQHPRNLTALYYYGLSKHQLGTHRSAQKSLEYAHKLAPDVPEIRVALIRLYVDMNMDEDARTHLKALKHQLADCAEPCETRAPLKEAIHTAEAAFAITD